ncbi:portal protein [Ensifer sesbaniae]|uniref:portal protein n=1 Tax=Ensifer sesbaniae TaxID=1214071 RepID=UPI0020011F7F|nr:portal protein [Ensifer sesbaniae]
MTEEESILKTITPQLKSAVTWSNSHIANKREEALKRYKREALPGDDKLQKGKSKYVSSEIQQHVDWLNGQLIRIFGSHENVVEFVGIGPEDTEVARQQTRVVNWILKTKNSHGAYLQPWIQNGLLTGLGIITAEFQTYAEESLPRTLKNVPNEVLVALDQQEEAGQIIIESVGKAQTQPGPMGIVETRDVQIRTIKRIPCFNILSVAPEDFLVSKDAKFDNETGGIAARIQGHRKLVSKGDLLEMGFDKEKVNSLPAASDKTDGIALERTKDLAGERGVGPDDVEVFTVYTKARLGKDTKARHYRLTIGGDIENRPILLDYTEVSKYYPYAAFVPYPIADTLFGLGVADRLNDDLLMLTRYYRGLLDNLSEHVNPMKFANIDNVNVDDLLNPHAGKVVRVNGNPSEVLSVNPVPFVGANALPVLSQLEQKLEYVTGTGPTMQGTNAQDFQRTSATAANLRSNASQLIIELISRFFADTGYRYLVKMVVQQLIDNPEDATALISRLTNEAIPLDEFSTDFDVDTSVGFDVLSRDQSAAQLSNIVASQMQAMQMGLPIVDAQKIFTANAKLAETAGFKNPSLFWTDPATLPPAPPPPPPVDPNAGLIEVEKVKAQLKAQSDELNRQAEMTKFNLEMDFKRDMAAQEFELKKAEIEAKYAAQVQVERLKLEQSMPRDPMGNIIQ